MKKAAYIFTIFFLAFGMLAFANNGDKTTKKAVVSNYSDVLKQIEYPQVCREQGIEGTVLVRVSLNEKGQMISHEFVKYPCTDLKDVVAQKLAALTFKPAIENGEAVSSKLLIPIEFKLTL
jgi:TonB family protein